MPRDLAQIRELLSRYLQGTSPRWIPGAYTGQLTANASPHTADAANMYGALGNTVAGMVFPGISFLNANQHTGSQYLANGQGYLAAGAAPPQEQGLSWLNQAQGAFGDLLNNGGMANLTPAMDAIRAQSDVKLQNTLAGLRERYGAMGLGASSDVAAAQAQGASTGIADMNAQQQQLLASAWQAAQQNRLGATSLAPTMAAAGAQPYENWANRQLQAAGITPAMASASGSNVAGIAGAYGSLANAYASGMGTAGQGYAGLAGQDMQLQLQNIQNLYNEFQRMQNPTGWLSAALNFGTNNPYTQASVVQSSSPWNSILGLAGTLGGALLGNAGLFNS